MMRNKFKRNETLCICIGLLMVSSSGLLRDWFTLPDLFAACWLGWD